MFASKTEKTLRYAAVCSKRSIHWLALVIFAALAVSSLTFLGRSLASNAKKAGSPHLVPTPGSRSGGPLRGLGTSLESEVEPLPQAGSTQVVINFDEIAPFTDVSARYAKVRFSSPGLSVYSWSAPAPKSQPNTITRGILQGPNVDNRHSAELIIDFPQPANNLKFYITGGDNFGTVALYDYYQNGNLVQSNLPIGGPGPSHAPIPMDFQAAGIGNVTRIKIHNITDHLGLTFDEFSFTVAAPSPTPTPVPSPTPPAAPTNLNGLPDENSATLSWSPSSGAVSYLVKRSGDNCSDAESLIASEAANSEGTELTAMVPVPTGSTTFVDTGLCAGHTYNYVVSAVGPSGLESGNSNSVSLTPLPNGCSATPTPTPAPGSIAAHGWSMNYEFSNRDGLVLKNIWLNQRKMAERFSVPYFLVDAYTQGQAPVSSRGELRPNGSNADVKMRSRLVGYTLGGNDPNSILLTANYMIDRIPGTPNACLSISQQYEFWKEGYVLPCEPSATVKTCAQFRPMIDYSFRGLPNEVLRSITIPERHHYQITDAYGKGTYGNSVGVFRDADIPGGPLLQGRPGLIFEKKENPLGVETQYRLVWPGGNKGLRDNIHWTNHDEVSEPIRHSLDWRSLITGCPECMHLHWRWGSFLRYFDRGVAFNGQPIIQVGSKQGIEMAIVRHRPGQLEEHPDNYRTLANGEAIREPITVPHPTAGMHPIIIGERPLNVVMWYVPTGITPQDKFFTHFAWFNARDPDRSASANSIQSEEGGAQPVMSDGPISVQFTDLFEEGITNFANYDLSSLPPLPLGYAALNNTAYKITSTAVAAGPRIRFSAASVDDQLAFNKLRIFHVEPDPFDPEKPMWVDRTILAPDAPSPDFSSKTLSAATDELGVFVIATLVQSIPPSTDVANIRVTCSDSADPILAPNNLSYTLVVNNNGPQMASELAVLDRPPMGLDIVSITSSQGTCKEVEGNVYCSLGTLAAGSSATVIITGETTEGNDSISASGEPIHNTALARAKEADSDPHNNSVIESTLLFPNPNKGPAIALISPLTGNLVPGPADISITATATDPDGSISKVEFFDNGELIGTGTAGAGNTYSIAKTLPACQSTQPGGNHPVHHGENPCNVHSFLAVATDNGGRQNISNAVNVIVNGTATVNITSPTSGALLSPNSQITLGAFATHPSGFLSEVEFFANGHSLGHGTANGGSQYTLTWNNVNAGTYSIFAIATDGSGITTTSTSVDITVDAPPTVTMATPADGSVFPSSTNISVSANSHSVYGSIGRVDFYANGILIASSTDVGTNTLSATWRNVPDGVHLLTAVATDNLGVSTTSAPITIGVNTASPRPGEFVWFDDALPPGAVKHADGDVDWYWVDANPGAFSGTRSHQSRNFGQLEPPNSFHQHYFDNATTTLSVNAGDKLFTYVFLDINQMPREIMLQWKDANNWDHRAYWGENRIDFGIDGTNSRRYMGTLPQAGQWVRLEVPASQVGLEGATLNGMAFTLDGGRATFDLAGKTTANAPPPPTTEPGDFVWIEDSLPTGAVPAVVDDSWNWVSNPHYSGQSAHLTFFASDGGKKLRSHSFTGAQTPMQINPGDVLFTYVHLGDPDPTHPANVPDQIMLQWHDGTSWEHRAFWGVNYIGTRIPNMGVLGTENQRYMGGLPAVRGWYRLEVPASYVGLEGKAVSGMAFTSYRDQNNPFVAWDRSGKSSTLISVPIPLSSTTGVFRSSSSNHGYAFETPNVAPSGYLLGNVAFHAYPKPAAGTVPFNRFLNPAGNERFYSRFSNHSGWVPAGTAFHVFPDAGTPGTVPLHLYHNNLTQYFLTLDQNEALSMGLLYDGIWAYVYPNIPAMPTSLTISGCILNWTDNSNSEIGFKIEHRPARTSLKPTKKWSQIATVAANVTTHAVSCPASGYYRVRAYNSTGHSGYSNEVWAGGLKDYEPDPPNTAPEVNIVSPANGDLLDHDFLIAANAFDLDGNGTIAKVEFFANGIKLGELADSPYVFAWRNAEAGNYSLTAKATDIAGATTVSTPVNVTVNVPPTIVITSPAGGTVFNSPATITISATAFDDDGSVSKVELFQGDIKLGEDANAPYGFDWSGVPIGSYSLTAKATDNLSATTTSNSISLTVVQGSTSNKIVFASNREGIAQIYSMNSDGSSVFRLTTNAANDESPKWSPNNSRIVFQSDRDNPFCDVFDIYSMNSGGSAQTRLTTDINDDRAPVWSPDGTKIAFQSLRNGVNYQVYVMNADGSGQVNISDSTSNDTQPSWSPDGTRIAFASDRDQAAFPSIYVMNANGSSQTRLTVSSSGFLDDQPAWSPDGTKLAFISTRDSTVITWEEWILGELVVKTKLLVNKEIYVMNADGSAQVRLTNIMGNDDSPAWSPDGTKVAFRSDRERDCCDPYQQVWVMNADGTNQANISNSQFGDYCPNWSR